MNLTEVQWSEIKLKEIAELQTNDYLPPKYYIPLGEKKKDYEVH